MKRFISESLAAYLEAAADVQTEALQVLPAWMDVYKEIDQIWRLELFEGATGAAPVASSLCMQSFFFWLASVRVALSGHSSATYPLLRTSLEAACYARRIAQDGALARVWLDRERDAAGRKACIKAFGSAVAEVAKSFEDEPSFATSIREMYDAAIDFGAHPNPRGILEQIRMEDTDGHTYVTTTAIHSIRSHSAMRSIVAVAEHGYFCIAICANSLGEPARAATLQQRLDAVILKVQNLVAAYSSGSAAATES